MRQIKSLQLDTYSVVYTATDMQIGCERHAIEAWWLFSDGEIDAMDEGTSLEWWNNWKPVLRQIIELSPAEPCVESNDPDSEAQ